MGQPEIVVVVGMHRCGTSVLTRGLLAGGVYLGDAMLPSAPDNPKGYWEDVEVLRINELLLKGLRADEQSLRWFSSEEISLASNKNLRQKALSLIEERLSHGGRWAFKDPRTARLLPFWRSIFAELGVREKYVIALRNPLDSANSFSFRNNNQSNSHPVDLAWGTLLWFEYMLATVHWLQDSPAVVIEYQNLLENPEREILRGLRLLDIPFTPEAQKNIEKYSRDFVDRNLQHFSSSADEMQDHPDVLPIITEAYKILSGFSSCEKLFNPGANSEFWSQCIFSIKNFSPIIQNLTKTREEWRSSRRLKLSFRYWLLKKGII